MIINYGHVKKITKTDTLPSAARDDLEILTTAIEDDMERINLLLNIVNAKHASLNKSQIRKKNKLYQYIKLYHYQPEIIGYVVENIKHLEIFIFQAHLEKYI
jgi:hypothetical protein